MIPKSNSRKKELFIEESTLVGHSSAIYSISIDDSYIYSASGDKYVTRWHISNGTQDNFAIKLDHVPYCISCVSGTSHLVVGLKNGNVHVIDTVLKKELRCFNQHKSAVFSMSFNESQGHFYMGDANGYLSIWDTSSWELLMILDLSCGKIKSFHFSPEEGLLFVAKQNGEIGIFETTFYNEILSFKAHQEGVSSLNFNPVDKLLTSGGKDAYIRLWDLKGNLKKEIPAHRYVVYALERFNNQLSLSASRDGSIKIWKGNYEEVLQKIDKTNIGHNHSVNELIVLDETTFVSCSDDRLLKIFKYQGLT